MNKMDMAGWSEPKFNAIVDEMRDFLTRAVGFNAAHVRFVPVSGLTGVNLVRDHAEDEGGAAELLGSWYKGGTLVDAIDKFEPVRRKLDKPLRLCVSDVFKSLTLGGDLAIAGKLITGSLAVGDAVQMMPNGTVCTVKSIHINGKPIEIARSLDNVEVGLNGLEPTMVRAGSVMCPPEAGEQVPVTMRFTAHIKTFPTMVVPLLKGSQLTLHTQTTYMPVTIRKLRGLLGADGEIIDKRPVSAWGGRVGGGVKSSVLD